MPGSINNLTRNSGFSHSQQQAPQGPHGIQQQAGLTRPGEGPACINGMWVELNPVSSAGFTSSFRTPLTNEISIRRNANLASTQVNNLLTRKNYLKKQAETLADLIKGMTLDSCPSSKEIIHKETCQYITSLSQSQKEDLSESIEKYQEVYGDNFFMNLAAMGFRSLPEFLRHLPSEGGAQSIDISEFAERFVDHYGAPGDRDEGIEEARVRLAEALQEPSLFLKNVLERAPVVHGVPLRKGATSADNPVTTKLLGYEFLNAVLSGDSIRFNSFLSTTSSYREAMQFCGRMASDGMGEAEYVVDLTRGDDENETLRRELKRDLDSGRCNTGAVLFYMKSENTRGISVNAANNAAKVAPGAPNRLDSEDEILLAPGHYCGPEQIIKSKDGLIVIGTLRYGEGR